MSAAGEGGAPIAAALSLGDRDSQMQTVIFRGLRHAYHSSTRSECILKNSRADLRLRVQHVRCSRAYSSVSSGNRDKTAVGVFSPTAAAIFIATGAGLFYYFNSEKESLKKKKEEEFATKAYGRPQVGGPFSLRTHEDKPFTDKDLLGKWTLIYFGFTNCPDICPEELDKMSGAVTTLEKQYGTAIQPVFISVDPPRDTPARIAAYLSEFHPRLIGLTGSYNDTKAVCKAYRVYFSTPPTAKADDDYLVDHSIFFYFMDPDGRFVDAFGKDTNMEDVILRVQKEIGEWEKDGRWKV